jgi:exopolyphosphatase / guanosine-5'-triphosphate,3'-diphosphate pyrophosphatase
MPENPELTGRLVGVLDMGATAIRLVIAEADPARPIRIIEEASRGVLLGRDVFSSGVIRSQTVDAVLTALDGFRHLMNEYGVRQIRAVATSAVREARNAEMVLDRIRGRTGITFEIINEAEESRLVYLAVRQVLRGQAPFRSARALLVEVGGGSTSAMLLRRGQPNRSGVYALGAVRMRQQFDVRSHQHELQISLLKHYIANVVEEMRVEIPLSRVTHMVAVGGDVRFAAAQILERDEESEARGIPRPAFLAFCDEVERLDAEGLVDRFRLPAVEAETLVPSLLVYRALLSETAAQHVTVADASLRAGVLLDLAKPGGRLGAEDFERQVLASAETLGQKYRFDAEHGRHVAKLANSLFEQLRDEHGLSDRDRLLLQVAALVHDIGVYVSLRAHHRHSQYLLAASQIFGLTGGETAMVANIARYHRRALPQDSHLSYIALDRQDRVIVSKLAALLRVANALDAEHLQKVREVRLLRKDARWILEIEGTGDLTMEQMATNARLDMFTDIFGRPVQIRLAGVLT